LPAPLPLQCRGLLLPLLSAAKSGQDPSTQTTENSGIASAVAALDATGMAGVDLGVRADAA